MNLARTDTYINVYLPRPDGEDPRTYANPTSPLYDEEKTFRFSDQIQKDRPLFLGKKQLSLYEIYYKDSRGYVSLEKQNNEHELEEKDDNEGGDNKENNAEHAAQEEGERQTELPSLNKVSLSLDAKIKQRYRKPPRRRFNEPLNAYVSNRKRVQSLTRFDPNSSLERQVTSFEYVHNSQEKTLYDFTQKIDDNVYNQQIQKRAQEKTLYDFAHQSDTVSIARLHKKAQSAPSDIRHIRSLGLPPISVSHSRRSTRVPVVVLPIKQAEDAIRVLPIRPNTKPHKVWRQTTDILTDRHASRNSRIPKLRYLTQQPAVDLTITSDSMFKAR